MDVTLPSNQEDLDEDLPAPDAAMLSAMGFSTFGMQSKPSTYKTKNQQQNNPAGASSSHKFKRQKFSHQNHVTGANNTPLSIRDVHNSARASGHAEFPSTSSYTGTGQGTGANEETLHLRSSPGNANTFLAQAKLDLQSGRETDNNNDNNNDDDDDDDGGEPHYEDELPDKPDPNKDDRRLAAWQKHVIPPSASESYTTMSPETSIAQDPQSLKANHDQEKYPPKSRKLSNGDYSFFMQSFIEDPWEGMVARSLVKKGS